jgi:hypothetical protein
VVVEEALSNLKLGCGLFVEPQIAPLESKPLHLENLKEKFKNRFERS